MYGVGLLSQVAPQLCRIADRPAREMLPPCGSARAGPYLLMVRFSRDVRIRLESRMAVNWDRLVLHRAQQWYVSETVKTISNQKCGKLGLAIWNDKLGGEKKARPDLALTAGRRGNKIVTQGTFVDDAE